MAERPPRALRWIGLGAVLAVLGLYLPVLSAPFEYDDKVEILLNEVIRSPSQVGEMVGYNPFRVLLLYTFAWDLWAWGFRPEGYRALNIAIHAVNCLLLAGLLHRLSGRLLKGPSEGTRRAFTAIGTLFFAVHPLAIESVTYISGRSSSLATGFVLLSTYAYLRFAEAGEDARVDAWLQERGRRLNRTLAVLLGAGLLAGLPAALLFATERLSGQEALRYGVGGAAALGALAAVMMRGDAAAADVDADVARRGRRAAGWYTLAFASFGLGVITKEIAATLPGVLLAIEAIALRGSFRAVPAALRGRLFPFFGIPLFLVLLRVAAYGYVASPVFIRPWTTNLLTQLEVVVQYGRLWALPEPQSVYHDWPQVPPPGRPLTWLSAALLLGLLGAAQFGWKRAPAAALGVLIALGTLAPTSSIFALKETMVEHRTYLPSVGVAFVAGWLFTEGLPRRLPSRLALGLAVAWLIGLAGLNLRYNKLWMSEEGLWRHAVTVNPDAADAWRYLGDLTLRARRWQEAEVAFREALRADPADVEAMSKLGHVLGASGRLDEAAALFDGAIALRPCHTPAINNLAFVHRKRADPNRAVELYTRSLQCEPNYTAHRGLADIYYLEIRNRDKAAHHYHEASELLDPLSPDQNLIKERLMELSW